MCALDSTSCQSHIVSSTLVATVCGHAADNSQIMDPVILWRGRRLVPAPLDGRSGEASLRTEKYPRDDLLPLLATTPGDPDGFLRMRLYYRFVRQDAGEIVRREHNPLVGQE